MIEPTSYQLAILAGLQAKPHIYGGTVSPATKARRRARAKVARVSRRLNRAL